MKRRLLILPLISLLVSGCNFFDQTSITTRPNSGPSSTTGTSISGDSSTISSGTSNFSSSSSSSITPTDDYPTNISVNPLSKIASVGDEFDITVTFYPSTATIREVTWTSSNKTIASVDENGHVIAHSAGKATIKATAKRRIGTISASCALTVKNEEGTITKTKLDYTYTDFMEYSATGFNNCPLVGEPKLLIIPIWFTDSSTYISSSKKESIRDDIRKTYVGTNEETGWRSVKTFYEEESKGVMSLNATISNWYSCGDLISDYKNPTTGADNTRTLLDEAVTWYFTNNPSDSKSKYDTDDDGYFDGVMLIYGAPDFATLKESRSVSGNLWAYCSWTQANKGTISNPKVNVYFWASYDFMYGDNATDRTGFDYGGGDTDHCTLDAHTFIHEMGHVLGLEDYYDYGSNKYSPAGGFSMQDDNVGGHDPYSVIAYGWADPYIPTDSMEITINDFQSSHDVILLANHDVNSPLDEYMLLELYTPTGLNEFDSDYQYQGVYPQGPKEPGIRLWHVDARLSEWQGGSSFSTSLTSNPTAGRMVHAMSNSYGGQNASYLGEDYYDYNILQLIRRSTFETYKTKSSLTGSNLFFAEKSFDMSTYSKQFVNGTYMNDGKALGWTFSVESIVDNQAVISLTKV